MFKVTCLEEVAIYANLCMNNKGLVLHFKYTHMHEITFTVIDKEQIIVFIYILLTWFFNIYKVK